MKKVKKVFLLHLCYFTIRIRANSLLFRFELFRLLRNNIFCNRCAVKFYRHSLMIVNEAVQQIQAGFTGTVRLAIRTAPDLSTATLVS